ncbi:MAG TPA: chaperone modulator CbpM [Opitutaceae bacterium]|nr:chaperone modulator CbpM [Opitutaceae bacterium]
MNAQIKAHVYALQPFTPNTKAVYPLDIAAHLARMPRHRVLMCYKRGLISPRIDPTYGGYSFDVSTIRTLQHIEYLCTHLGVNFSGIRIILDLMKELEQLRANDRGFDASSRF